MADKQLSIGGIWIKQGQKGEFLSISIDIGEGVKKSFLAFRNDYKKEGDKAPDYKIYESKPKEEYF